MRSYSPSLAARSLHYHVHDDLQLEGDLRRPSTESCISSNDNTRTAVAAPIGSDGDCTRREQRVTVVHGHSGDSNDARGKHMRRHVGFTSLKEEPVVAITG
jgi:hypothetical protein